MSAGASGGADIEGRAFNAGPVGVNLADPQGTAAGLAQAQEAQNAFNAAMEAQIAAQTLGGWISPTNTINALTGKPMDTLELAMENAKTQQAIEDSYSIFDYSGPQMPNPALNPGWNYQDPMFDENLSGFPHTGSGITIGGFTVDPNYNPGVSLIDPVDVTPSTNPGAKSILDAFGIENQTPTNQEEVDSLMDDVLGFGITDPLGLDNALATNLYSFPNQYLDYYEMDDFGPILEFDTTIPNPAFDPENIKNNPQDVWDAIDSIPDFNLSSVEIDPVMDSVLSGVEGFMEAGGVLGGGSGVIGPNFDTGAVSRTGGGELQEALAQRVAETIIAQQAARQVTPQSNRVTIPVSSGPDIVIDVTPPEPRNPVRSRPVRPEVEQRNPSDSPIRIAAKSITKPKAFKKLPKFAQRELRRGEVPTTGSDYVQDMVRDFLGSQKTVGDSGTRR